MAGRLACEQALRDALAAGRENPGACSGATGRRASPALLYETFCYPTSLSS